MTSVNGEALSLVQLGRGWHHKFFWTLQEQGNDHDRTVADFIEKIGHIGAGS